MTIAQVFDFYKDKRDVSCPITDELMKAGLIQSSGGYLSVACVTELACPPSQWWHLMQYCLGQYEKKRENRVFPKSIRCCELLLWMTEVSGAVEEPDLPLLKDEILNIGISNRGKISNHIYDKYWSDVQREVEGHKNK